MFEASKARKLVANLDDTMLIGLEKEANIAVVYYGRVFILCCFFGCKLDVGIYPRLPGLDLIVQRKLSNTYL